MLCVKTDNLQAEFCLFSFSIYVCLRFTVSCLFVLGFMYVHMCTDAHRSPKRALGPLELDLQPDVSHHMGVRNGR